MKAKSILLSCIIAALCVLSYWSANAQAISRRVLFIGNSYTYVNDLPGMTASVAASAGDTLVYDSHTVGGWSLYDHAFDTTTTAKIESGNWNYIVLQPQSLEFADANPWANSVGVSVLHQFIDTANPCGQTVFYMTWGYKNGFAANCPILPYMCTYDLMDSVIRRNFITIADTYSSVISPVGAVRHYIRENYPSIELYQSDDSHPTVAGTYAAACCFYAIIFRRDPSLITYNPGLSVTDAANIRVAAKTVAFDSLSYWNVGRYDSATSARCSATGITPVSSKKLYWDISPNPATDILTIRSANYIGPVLIYNLLGEALKEVQTTSNTTMNISDLPRGIYFMRAKNYPSQVLKFVKQ